MLWRCRELQWNAERFCCHLALLCKYEEEFRLKGLFVSVARVSSESQVSWEEDGVN